MSKGDCDSERCSHGEPYCSLSRCQKPIYITTITDGKTSKHQHPITWVSGLFQGSQWNVTTLTKKAYVIYDDYVIIYLWNNFP